MLRSSKVSTLFRHSFKPVSAGILVNLVVEWISYNRKLEEPSVHDTSTFCYRRCKYLFIQAMHDMGVKGEIHFDDRPITFSKSAGVYRTFDAKMQRISVVSLDMRYISCLPPNQIYAIAGHEAAHLKYHHSHFKFGLTGAFTYLLATGSYKFLRKNKINPAISLLLVAPITLYSAKTIFPVLSQVTEYNADIFSAKKLGTAPPLINFMLKHPDKEEDSGKSRQISTHPSMSKRIDYLSKLPYKKCHFFTTPVYSKLLEEHELANSPAESKNMPQSQSEFKLGFYES